ncbi:hypothetical protein PMI37_05625, partial [Pseudomonas sp. GM80]
MIDGLAMIVPTLCVGMPPVTLRVTVELDAERPGRRYHAERGNDHRNDSMEAQVGAAEGCDL